MTSEDPFIARLRLTLSMAGSVWTLDSTSPARRSSFEIIFKKLVKGFFIFHLNI
jgi:hypothetical protein